MSYIVETPPAGYLPVVLKFGPYSASKLLTARCPARFQGRYVYKDQVISESINAARGSAIHYVLERMDIARLEGRAANVGDLVSEAIGQFPAAYTQADLVRKSAGVYSGNPSPYFTKDTKLEISVGIQRWVEESFVEDTVPNWVYTVVPGTLEDGRTSNPAAFLTCKLDQLSIDEQLKTVTVLDHKSAANASFNPDTAFQLQVYAWMAHLLYPGYTIRTVIHYTNPDLNFYTKPNYWSDEDLQEAEDEVVSRIRAIERFQEYPALPGSHCDYCHMVQQCPQFQKVFEQDAKGALNMNAHNIPDLQRIAGDLRVVGVLYDRLNNALKEGIEMHCPEGGIAIEGMWYGFKPSDAKVDWDATERKIREEAERAALMVNELGCPPEAKKQYELLIKTKNLDGLLEAHGLSARTFLSWKGDKLKALFKTQKEDLLSALKPLLVFDKGTRWGGYKS